MLTLAARCSSSLDRSSQIELMQIAVLCGFLHDRSAASRWRLALIKGAIVYWPLRRSMPRSTMIGKVIILDLLASLLAKLEHISSSKAYPFITFIQPSHQASFS
jgi:hypothetical protein